MGNIEHIEDTIEGIQKALIDHGDNHSQNVYKIHELNAFTNNLKENFNQNVEKFDQQNKSNIYALQELCKDLEVKQNVSSKTIQDLDQGNQSLLNKLIDLENKVGQNVTALKSKDSEIDDRILSMTQDLLSVKNETNKHLEKVLMEQVSEINEIKETAILQKDQLTNQSTRITLCEKQIKHCDDTFDHLKGNIESSEKKTADLNHSINNIESGLSEKFKVMKDDVDKKIEKSSQLLDSQTTDLEKKIKANTDNIKNLEDSLDGLRSTVDGQEVKHSSTDAKFNEFNIQINERFNASEEKIAKNSQTSNNETKSLINDLVEKQNVSSQQIKELDQGNQGLLEKLLNLEKNLGDGFSTLEATDKNIGENVNSLNKDLAAVKDIFE